MKHSIELLLFSNQMRIRAEELRKEAQTSAVATATGRRPTIFDNEPDAETVEENFDRMALSDVTAAAWDAKQRELNKNWPIENQETDFIQAAFLENIGVANKISFFIAS